MNKVFQENKELVPKGPAALGLHPISHKEFSEFIKGKGFTGRNNYKLKDLKYLPMEWNQRDSIPCQRLQPLLEYHMQPSYMLKRIPDLEFALMEKNMSLNLSLVKMPQ